jgi:hypothetical protein
VLHVVFELGMSIKEYDIVVGLIIIVYLNGSYGLLSTHITSIIGFALSITTHGI